MVKQIINLVATTELEAVNAMLASIGEAAISTLDGATATDVETAINIFRNTTREVQSEGWRFNTEFGLEIPSVGSYSRTDTTGVTTVLKVFTPPVGLVAFEMSQSPKQQGSKYTDAVIRPAKEYIPDVVIASDSFTAVTGTELSTHADNNGNTWAKIAGLNLLIDSANGLSSLTADSGGQTSIYKNSLVMSAANPTITALFTPVGSITDSGTFTIRLCTDGTGTKGWELELRSDKFVYLRSFASLDVLGRAPAVLSTNGLYAGAWPATLPVTFALTATTVTATFGSGANMISLSIARNLSYGNPVALELVTFWGTTVGAKLFLDNLNISGPSTVQTPVFYDRVLNRDGWVDRDFLYIDPTWLFDFEQLPETCRNFIVVQSSRRLAQKALGNAELSSFSDKDELRALRKLKRDQGEEDDYNIFDNSDVSRTFNERMPGISGVSDPRSSPGRA